MAPSITQVGNGFQSTVRGHPVYIKNILFRFQYLTNLKQFGNQKAIEMDMLSQASIFSCVRLEKEEG